MKEREEIKLMWVEVVGGGGDGWYERIAVAV